MPARTALRPLLLLAAFIAALSASRARAQRTVPSDGAAPIARPPKMAAIEEEDGPGAIRPSRPTIAPPATAPNLSPSRAPASAVSAAPRPLATVEDPLRALVGTRVELLLGNRDRLSGELVHVDTVTASLALDDSGDIVRVLRSGIVRMKKAEVVTNDNRLRYRIAEITKDLEARSDRKIGTGAVMTWWGLSSFTLMFVGVGVTIAGNRNGDQTIGIITMTVFGPIAATQLMIGIPIYVSGYSERDIVRQLKRPWDLRLSSFTSPSSGGLQLAGRF